MKSKSYKVSLSDGVVIAVGVALIGIKLELRWSSLVQAGESCRLRNMSIRMLNYNLVTWVMVYYI